MTSTTTTRPRTQSRDFTSVWDRYGGGDIPATFGGLLAAIGTILTVAGLIAAGAGNIALQIDTIDIEGNLEELTVAGAIAAVVVLFFAFLIGGWVAARMARFDGPKNGMIVALWMLALVVLFGALGIWAGSEYNVFAQINLPDWVSQWNADDVTLAVSLAASAGVLAMFAGGYVGGWIGEAYNRKVDAAIANAPIHDVV